MINTHFDHIGKEARKNSAALLKQKASEIAKGFPLIITGDFNCTREEPPYSTIMDPKRYSPNGPGTRKSAGNILQLQTQLHYLQRN